MTEKAIDKFELPRKDWYDVVGENPLGQIIGRIYKDALIENFNAIEAKLIDITELDALDIQLPDFSKIVYPDTTLDSSDNDIVNLKSLCKICDIRFIPFNFIIDGTKISFNYIGGTEDNPVLMSIVNYETSASDKKKYIWLNINTNSIECSEETYSEDYMILVGVYTNNRIFTNESPRIINKG